MSSSAASRPRRRANRTSTRPGASTPSGSGPSKITSTSRSALAAHPPSCATSRCAAPARSFHQPSGRLPMTLLPSTTTSTPPILALVGPVREVGQPHRAQHPRVLEELDLVVLDDLDPVPERVPEVQPRAERLDTLGGEHAPRSLLVVDDEPEVPVLPGAGREQRDELVAEVDERAPVRALDVPDVEQPAVESDRALDVFDLQRDMVDPDRTRTV